MVGSNEPGAFGDGDQGAQVVEQVDEEEDEDDFEQALAEGPRDIEMEGGLSERADAAWRGGPVRQVQRPGEGGDREHADEDGALHLADFEGHHQNQTE